MKVGWYIKRPSIVLNSIFELASLCFWEPLELNPGLHSAVISGALNLVVSLVDMIALIAGSGVPSQIPYGVPCITSIHKSQVSTDFESRTPCLLDNLCRSCCYVVDSVGT